MTTTHTSHSDWLASIGNPTHHVVIGPDWWGCRCGTVGTPHTHGEPFGAHGHAADHNAVTVDIPWQWSHVEADGRSMADTHRALWETGDIG